MEFDRLDCNVWLVFAFTVLFNAASSRATHMHNVSGINVTDFSSNPSKTLATFVLKFAPKGKSNRTLIVEEQEIKSKAKLKKDRETIKLISSDAQITKDPADKLSELKVFREFVNALDPSSKWQHNLTDGANVGNKKAGRLRFRISTGPVRQSEARVLESIFREANNARQEENPSHDTDSKVSRKTNENSEENTSNINNCNPITEDPAQAEEALHLVKTDATEVSKTNSTLLKIFKNMAQQFDALQDLFDNNNCGGGDNNNFDRNQNKLTLENMSSCQGNVTRIRFIRRKVTGTEKKP